MRPNCSLLDPRPRPDLGPSCTWSPCSSYKVRTAGDTNRRWLLGKKKKRKKNSWLPAFLSPHTTRGKLSPRCAHSLWLLLVPWTTLSFPPAPAAGLQEPQPEWVTGFTSAADWPLPLQSHPLPHTCLLVELCRRLEGAHTWRFSGPGQVRAVFISFCVLTRGERALWTLCPCSVALRVWWKRAERRLSMIRKGEECSTWHCEGVNVQRDMSRPLTV